MTTKTVPGPNFRVDNSLPCGCRINRDTDTQRFRLWYCTTHAAAFEVLDALRANADALGTVMKEVPSEVSSVGYARDAEMRARMAIRRRSKFRLGSGGVCRDRSRRARPNDSRATCRG